MLIINYIESDLSPGSKVEFSRGKWIAHTNKKSKEDLDEERGNSRKKKSYKKLCVLTDSTEKKTSSRSDFTLMPGNSISAPKESKKKFFWGPTIDFQLKVQWDDSQ